MRRLNKWLVGAIALTFATDWLIYEFLLVPLGKQFETNGAWTLLGALWQVFMIQIKGG